MQKFIQTTPNPENGFPRTNLLLRFNWNILEDNIKVPCRTYYVKSNHTTENPNLEGSIPFKEKELTIDNKDRIDLTTGNLVVEADYNEETYPSTIGQYDGMMALTTEDLFEKIFPGVKAKLETAGITEFKLPYSSGLLAMIEVNVIESDVVRKKFDI